MNVIEGAIYEDLAGPCCCSYGQLLEAKPLHDMQRQNAIGLRCVTLVALFLKPIVIVVM